MTPSADFDPESYIASLFERHDEFGAEYVRRQVEWAEAILQERLSGKSSSMAATCAPGEAVFASPSAASAAIVAS